MTQAEYTPQTRYVHYGYRFDIPGNEILISITKMRNRYKVVTNKNEKMMKHCPRCKRILEVGSFYEGGTKSTCKECHILLVKSLRKKRDDDI